MPRGYPNPKSAPAPATEPAPMILIEPAADGAIRLNAYGLSAGEVVDALRRSLIHLHAQRAGVQVISLQVPPMPAVALPARAPVASRNSASGKATSLPPSKAGVRKRRFDEGDEDYFTDGIGAAVGDER